MWLAAITVVYLPLLTMIFSLWGHFRGAEILREGKGLRKDHSWFPNTGYQPWKIRIACRPSHLPWVVLLPLCTRRDRPEASVACPLLPDLQIIYFAFNCMGNCRPVGWSSGGGGGWRSLGVNYHSACRQRRVAAVVSPWCFDAGSEGLQHWVHIIRTVDCENNKSGKYI